MELQVDDSSLLAAFWFRPSFLDSQSCGPPSLWWLDFEEYEARVNLYFFPGVTAFGRESDALEYQTYVTLRSGLDELSPSLTDPSALCSQS